MKYFVIVFSLWTMTAMFQMITHLRCWCWVYSSSHGPVFFYLWTPSFSSSLPPSLPLFSSPSCSRTLFCTNTPQHSTGCSHSVAARSQMHPVSPLLVNYVLSVPKRTSPGNMKYFFIYFSNNLPVEMPKEINWMAETKREDSDGRTPQSAGKCYATQQIKENVVLNECRKGVDGCRPSDVLFRRGQKEKSTLQIEMFCYTRVCTVPCWSALKASF